MSYNGFAGLRDDFADNATSDAWTTYAIGSATVAETGGQFVVTLPSSTAGSHEAGYYTSAPYSLASDSFYINVATMVATGVAATAVFDLRLVAASAANVLRWRQVSNTITARHIVAGTDTQVYTATWSATTYKYLRIRADTTTVYWDSSSNGTSWTNRASVAISSLFPITDLYALMAASCGNIASPGTFKLDDVNIILPALTTNWRWTQALWSLTERLMPLTLALDTAGTAQAYVVTADDVDVNGDPSANIQYWSGPAKQGRELTLQATQAAAQAMAVNIPTDGRFDLPALTEARCVRLYHRSIDGNAYTIREFFPRRVVEADDIRAENIQALHIAAGTITADKLNALMVISNTISTDYNGARVTLSGDSFGGLIGYGASDTYSTSAGTGTYQVLWSKADGKFYAGAGDVILDSSGVSINIPATQDSAHAFKFVSGATMYSGLLGQVTGGINSLELSTQPIAATATQFIVEGRSPTTYDASVRVIAKSGSETVELRVEDDDNDATATGVFITGSGGLNVGSTASGAAAGAIISTINDAGTTSTPVVLQIGHNSTGTPAASFGTNMTFTAESTTTVDRNQAAIVSLWVTATDASRKARVVHFAYDTAAREGLRIEASGSAAMLGFFGAAAVTKPTVTGSRGGNAALASLLTAGANLGLWTDSSTA